MRNMRYVHALLSLSLSLYTDGGTLIALHQLSTTRLRKASKPVGGRHSVQVTSPLLVG